ncbi:MAG: VWA domain-containing protein [Gammaproteobacteria bacterium]|nr:VWA domain-containing protein [Pseudomonadales bacterium]MCP5346747.1 VWA domain-containing protein [Pseudomonadales bacterium]
MQFIDPNLLQAIEEGRFSFAYGISLPIFLLIVLALIGIVWFSYRKTTRQISNGWKSFFIGLRSLVLILLLVCLLRPVISTTQVTPQETYLGVLIDDSESMQVQDQDSQSRAGAVSNLLFENGFLDRLGETFQVRSFRFDKETRRIATASDLLGSGNASSLEQALQYVDDQLNGLPLAGIVLVTDGADNTNSDPVAVAESLGSRQVPVFTIGVGQENIPQDIGIVDVSSARTVLEGSVFDVQVAINHQGYQGVPVEVSILDGDTPVVSETITLGEAGVTRRYDLQLTPERREEIVYELQVALQEGEIIPENNRYQFLVDNSEKPPLDILYIEGHPRNEYKFIRRAVQGDSSLRLATYLQTGPEKFYRQGIESATELSSGFPETKEDLYGYETIILGDIEASFFNADQLQMIEDFVAERGGGFLVSGMVDEGYQNTPIADILPVTIVEENFLPSHLRGGIRRGDHPTGELYFPRLTRNGEFSPLMRLSSDDAENRRLWQELPELQGIHVTGRAKPGATVLLEHPILQFQNQPLPVIATQRYGSGRSMSINTASTWRWQMMMHSEDQSHETLWRQMLRWLAVSAPERITIDFDREFYNVGDEVSISATVLGDDYEPDNDATLWMQLVDPEGQVRDIPMEWDIEEDGVYRVSFVAENEGVHELLVDVTSAAADAAPDSSEKHSAFVVTPSLREYSNANMDAGLLERVAAASGGQYYNFSEAGNLLDEIEYVPNAYSREIQEDLWDRPWLLALLIVLLCTDWIARRMKGLS